MIDIEVDHLHKRFSAFFGNGVVHPFALFSADHDLGIAKDLHMVGKRRLGDMQVIKQHTYKRTACGQGDKQAQQYALHARGLC